MVLWSGLTPGAGLRLWSRLTAGNWLRLELAARSANKGPRRVGIGELGRGRDWCHGAARRHRWRVAHGQRRRPRWARVRAAGRNIRHRPPWPVGYGTKPAGATDSAEPARITDRPELTGVTDRPEPSGVTDRPEPSGVTDRARPARITDRAEPISAAYALKLAGVTDAAELACVAPIARHLELVAGNLACVHSFRA
jgi:hypothetical protein